MLELGCQTSQRREGDADERKSDIAENVASIYRTVAMTSAGKVTG